MSRKEKEDLDTVELASAYRIVRNMQDLPAKKIIEELKREFPGKSGKDIAEIVKRIPTR